MTSPGVVYIDSDESYTLRLPPNWTFHHEPEWRSLNGALTWVYENYPDATSYGWLADDTRPRTPGWDKALERLAGDWHLSYAKDLWFSDHPIEEERLRAGHNLSSGLCWGGELVRAVGWWCPTWLRQAGIDTTWCDIVRPLNLHRYTDQDTVEHLNWRTGKRAKDAVDDWDRNGDSYVERDIIAARDWLWSQEYCDLIARLRDTLGQPDTAAYRQAVAVSYADEVFNRNGKVNSAVIDNLHTLEAEVQRDRADERQA